jgi:hypothetical protein
MVADFGNFPSDIDHIRSNTRSGFRECAFDHNSGSKSELFYT